MANTRPRNVNSHQSSWIPLYTFYYLKTRVPVVLRCCATSNRILIRDTKRYLADKYLITSSQASDASDLAHLQLENVNFLLSFWAGRMEVPFVACEGWSDDETLSRDAIHGKAVRSFQVLHKQQRPIPRTSANVEEFIEDLGSAGINFRWSFAMDFAENITPAIHPEKHYLLNSKGWLAKCRLRSANDSLIDPESSCPVQPPNVANGFTNQTASVADWRSRKKSVVYKEC